MAYKKAHVIESNLADFSDKLVFAKIFTESKVKYIKHAVVIEDLFKKIKFTMEH